MIFTTCSAHLLYTSDLYVHLSGYQGKCISFHTNVTNVVNVNHKFGWHLLSTSNYRDWITIRIFYLPHIINQMYIECINKIVIIKHLSLKDFIFRMCSQCQPWYTSSGSKHPNITLYSRIASLKKHASFSFTQTMKACHSCCIATFYHK